MRINNSPDFGNFYIANETEPTNDQMAKLHADPFRNGFQATFFSDFAEAGSEQYRVGDKMKSTILYDSTNRMKQQFMNAFPFPKADSFGNCNNFKSAYFMEDDESSCMQVTDLTNNCANLLSPEFYSTRLQIYMGARGLPANNKQVTIGEIWGFNDQTMVYTKRDAGNTALLRSSASQSGTTCSCSNYLKEVEYVVKLNLVDVANSATKYYEVGEVKANVVIGENPVTSTCGTKVGVHQTFKIRFLTTDSNSIQKNSGNPGYLDGYPLKLGFQANSGDPVSTYLDGFEISGSDLIGKCLQSPSTYSETRVIDYNDPVVKFNENLVYGCSVAYNRDTLK